MQTFLTINIINRNFYLRNSYLRFFNKFFKPEKQIIFAKVLVTVKKGEEHVCPKTSCQFKYSHSI